MPLDREHITAASAIMTKVYIGFFGIVGINFMLGPAVRVGASPMLRYADTIMPIQAWGGVFLGCSVLMLGAVIEKNRLWYRFALLMCAVSMIVWALIAAVGAFVEPVSYAAWAWPALVAAACLATNRSLLRGERDQAGG